MLKAIHASEDIAAAREKAIQVIEKLRGLRLTRAAELVEAAVEETLSYYAFPEEHWRRIRTNNPLERILREIRRRTRVVGAFPDGQSALNLAAARLRHIAGTAWSTKRYLNIGLLKDQQMRGAIHRLSQYGCRSAQTKVRKFLDNYPARLRARSV
jgi:putative transposase